MKRPEAHVAKILVIDDSALMRRILRSYLEAAGHVVEDWLPLSALDIPDRLAANPVDLILTDFQMTGVNGLTVAKMAMRAAPGVPVVVLTALADPEIAAQLAKFKVRRIVHKPITSEALLAMVSEVLGR
jgi:DNA-binding NarL/FixJ family response regulator